MTEKSLYVGFFNGRLMSFYLLPLFLKNTGTYIHAVTPPQGFIFPKPKDSGKENAWQTEIIGYANKWKGILVNGPKDTRNFEVEGLNEILTNLANCWNVNINDLYNCREENEETNVWLLCNTVLQIHAMADESFRGVGILSTDGNTYDKDGYKVKLLHIHADFLLTTRGTLSRLPKYFGIILPKARTPQCGTTIRSFSFNLSYHTTEVDVLWRTIPWYNPDEYAINVMIVPYPYTIHATDFSPVPHPNNTLQIGDHRYFTFKPSPKKPDNIIEKVIEQLKHVEKTEVKRIHFLIFPESSLTYPELKKLQMVLSKSNLLTPDKIPIIIAGVAGDGVNSPEEDKIPYKQFSETPDKPYNKIILSVYFADHWYEIIQNKHHRWYLDNNQIKQYGLAGVLTGGKLWWEHISIHRRTINFLSVIPWLTLCPLVCEDLARLDPVSEIIRSVGPNLLIAILLDGPQLKERWPGRYASVFADDPGTSVITATATGMARRSTRKINQKEISPDSESYQVKVALWKDSKHGFEEISAANDVQMPILNINAFWVDEVTGDGRKDATNSSLFELQDIQYPAGITRLTDEEKQIITTILKNDKDDELKYMLEPEKAKALANAINRCNNKSVLGAKTKWLAALDFYELTLFTYYIDSLVDILLCYDKNFYPFSPDHTAIKACFSVCFEVAKIFHDDDYHENSGFGLFFSNSVSAIIKNSVLTRDNVPHGLPSPQYLYSIIRAYDLLIKVVTDLESNQGNIYSEVRAKSDERLKEIENFELDTASEEFKTELFDCCDQVTELLMKIRPMEKEMDKEGQYPPLSTFSFFNHYRDVQIKRKNNPKFSQDVKRLDKAIIFTIYSSLHKWLSIQKRKGTFSPANAEDLNEIEMKLKEFKTRPA